MESVYRNETRTECVSETLSVLLITTRDSQPNCHKDNLAVAKQQSMSQFYVDLAIVLQIFLKV